LLLYSRLPTRPAAILSRLFWTSARNRSLAGTQALLGLVSPVTSPGDGDDGVGREGGDGGLETYPFAPHIEIVAVRHRLPAVERRPDAAEELVRLRHGRIS
jgi:hypothetical protein